jgi:hypothetical protein
MDMESDYYSYRCEDINGLWVGLLRRLWVETVIIKPYSILK